MNKDNNWYDRVYLCWEDININSPTAQKPINGFKCYKFNSFNDADNAWEKGLREYKEMNIRHSTIPVCKWVPEIFDNYIINRRLQKMFWLKKHTFGTSDNFISKK